MSQLKARKKPLVTVEEPVKAAPRSTPAATNGTAVSHGVPSVFNERCPSQIILERIADKWTVLIIHKLDKKTMRFGELKREIGGVSQKMLTQTLRNLEHDKLVERKVYPVVPPKVEYSLTPLGRTLLNPLGALCRWAQEHIEDVIEMDNRRRRKPAAGRTG
ncbi:MAG: helix-turn-helix transcriptional regulator [Planctomycetes bacterium]|nr:helix-turn-helix transcriptional regulator [Planctomycetota bacterium]